MPLISFFRDYFGQNRLIAWLTLGCVATLSIGVSALSSGLMRIGVDGYHADRVMADRAALAEDAFVDPVPRRHAAEAGSSGTAHFASENGSVTSESRANKDDDTALFAALERVERRMATAIARARESVVALEYTAPDAPPGTRRVATGVVINQRGEALSVRIDQPAAARASVAGSKPSVIVARDFSGRCHSVHWIAADPDTGLTLLRLPPRAVRPIRMASGGPNLGSQVFVVGNPFGMGHSVSRGHVAGLDRTLELGTRQLGGLIQVQAPVYPGDSGAAVVNLHGDWLGLIRSGLATPGLRSGPASEVGPVTPMPAENLSAGLSPSLGLADLSLGRSQRDTDFGFALPVQDALWVAEQLRTRGRVDRAYLGVRLEPASTAIDDRGAILREVLSGTPAAQAGLQPGDCIVEFDGQPIHSAHDLTDCLDRIPAQATIALSVVRDSGPRRERLSLSLRAAGRPRAQRDLGSVTRAPALAATPAIPEASPVLGAAPGGASIGMPSSVSSETAVPPVRPSELRFTLPRAVVERLEKLEQRLEKLESFPSGAPVDRQISSARNP